MSDVATIYLVVDAPISAWRWMQAGVYRGSFPVMPPSAAWGLVLNLAGIDTRGDLAAVTTPIRGDAPALEIAVGSIVPGQRSSLYQQLHSYPVGNSGGPLRDRAKGNKFWIAPARREVLIGAVSAIGARGPRSIIDRVAPGLAGQLDVERYGLPFAGDNQYLFSRVDPTESSPNARWYEVVDPSTRADETTRLTTNIDRSDASKTVAPLFAPMESVGVCPHSAWVRIGPAAG